MRIGKSVLTVALFALLFAMESCPAGDANGRSNWEKFKDGAKQAGGAAWDGTKNVADKTGHAVARGARRTGEAVSDGFHEVKDFVKEKLDDDQPPSEQEMALEELEVLPEAQSPQPVTETPEQTPYPPTLDQQTP